MDLSGLQVRFVYRCDNSSCIGRIDKSNEGKSNCQQLAPGSLTGGVLIDLCPGAALSGATNDEKNIQSISMIFSIFSVGLRG